MTPSNATRSTGMGTVGYVKYVRGGQRFKAFLREDGKWDVPHDAVTQAFLDLECSPRNFGPAYGIPNLAALRAAAEHLEGTAINTKRYEAMRNPPSGAVDVQLTDVEPDVDLDEKGNGWQEVDVEVPS